MQPQELRKLKRNVRAFFAEFNDQGFKNLSEKKVQELLNLHHLSVDTILDDYSQRIRAWDFNRPA